MIDRVQRIALCGLAVILLTVVAASAARAEAIAIEWVPATTCEDGRALTNCAVTGWEIQYSKAEWEPFTILKGVGATTLTQSFTVAPGNHCYRVRPNSTKGWGELSNVLCFDVKPPDTKPKAALLKGKVLP
jgi:hypothetical protein